MEPPRNKMDDCSCLLTLYETMLDCLHSQPCDINDILGDTPSGYDSWDEVFAQAELARDWLDKVSDKIYQLK